MITTPCVPSFTARAIYPHTQCVGSRVVSSYVKEVRLELRSTEAFVMRLLEDMIQVNEG